MIKRTYFLDAEQYINGEVVGRSYRVYVTSSIFQKNLVQLHNDLVEDIAKGLKCSNESILVVNFYKI